MEVRLDPDCLPAHKQEVQFQIVIEEINGKWRTGIYNDIEQVIYETVKDEEGNTDVITHCLSAEVVRWIPKDELPGIHWQDLPVKYAMKVATLIKMHNNSAKPN